MARKKSAGRPQKHGADSVVKALRLPRQLVERIDKTAEQVALSPNETAAQAIALGLSKVKKAKDSRLVECECGYSWLTQAKKPRCSQCGTYV